MKSVWFVVTTVLYCGMASHTMGADPVEPQTEAEARAAIEQVNREIATLTQLVTSQSKERNELQNTLKQTDKAIARANEALRRAKENIDARQRQINTLDAQGTALEREISQLSELLENALGAFSVLKQGGDLKIIFGDGSPQETTRHLAYFDLLLADQLKNIDTFKSTVAALDENRVKLAEEQVAQRKAREALSQEQRKLVSERTKQGDVIAALSRSLKRDGAQIQALKADGTRLNALLSELLVRLANLAARGGFENFGALSRKLRAPLDGASSTRFGQKRARGDLRWQGWLIPAERGSTVRSIHYGRVVYADWLRGQGLLTIVDHGDGWMSLYGQNESLLKETGEWVAPGEVIARVGSSGGATLPALYFEIRSQGVPVDPADWIR
ncbi:peptidoglycan DD-metalloendopeptidase family protein [Luminiphilus sp.]|nr:peptidoglycan DD-metalloendopeptidase family protein [Luminiphilus sp.]